MSHLFRELLQEYNTDAYKKQSLANERTKERSRAMKMHNGRPLLTFNRQNEIKTSIPHGSFGHYHKYEAVACARFASLTKVTELISRQMSSPMKRMSDRGLVVRRAHHTLARKPRQGRLKCGPGSPLLEPERGILCCRLN